jgi:WASH complex subunit strumpellin
MSDYVTVYGLKIWQEEFSRIINFFVEQGFELFLVKSLFYVFLFRTECAVYLHQEIYFWQSQYWNDNIPIPLLNGPPPVKGETNPAKNFVGRLALALLSHVDFRSSIYLDSYSAWFSVDGGRELVGIRTFSLLLRSVGVFGLHGIDRLLCFIMVDLLQRFVKKMSPVLDDDAEKEKQRLKAGGKGQPIWQHLDQIAAALLPASVLPSGGGPRLYDEMSRRVEQIFPMMLQLVGRLGQAQLVRRQIANALKFSSRLESGLLSSALDAVNQAVLADVQAHYAAPTEQPYPPPENTLIADLSTYLELSGVNDPLTKIYVTAELRTRHMPLLVFLFVLSELQNFAYDPALQQLINKNKKKGFYDLAPFVVGVVSLLKQFHSLHVQQFLAFLGQYVRTMVNAIDRTKKTIPDLPEAAVVCLMFLEEFVTYAAMPRRVLESYLPKWLLDLPRE